MEFNLMQINNSAAPAQAAQALVACNAFTAQYGLALSPAQAALLVARRGRALATNGRVEFGGGVVEKLLRAFAPSPFLGQEAYVEVMEALIEMFYAYKNETMDWVTDDDLIAFMVRAFNGVCQGSLELLEERELAQMAENLRRGHCADYVAPDAIDEDEEGLDGRA